jgi:hypothetical protein
VIEAEFFLELLVGLLADPSRLDRGGECCDPAWKSDPLKRGIGVQN